MKITDYPEATELASDDSFVIDGPTNGTRYIPQENLPWGEGGEGGSVPETTPTWVSHRNTYRGKNLGTIFTEEQKAAIADGTFDDLYIGDYWEVGNRTVRIADINYFKEDDNHIVVIPDSTFPGTTQGGFSSSYVSSKIFTTNLEEPKTFYNTFFGSDHILTHEEFLVNSSNSSGVTGSTAVDVTVNNPSTSMLTGSNYGFNIGGVYGTGMVRDYLCQFKLFELRPNFIFLDNMSYWTSTVTKSDNLVMVFNSSGYIHQFIPANTGSFSGFSRPYVAIK